MAFASFPNKRKPEMRSASDPSRPSAAGPGWRPLPPLVVLAGLAVMTAVRVVAPEPSPIPEPWTGLGPALALLGLAIAFTAAAQFRRRRANIQTFGEPTRLVTGGLFRLSRNPMYLGLALVLVGAAVGLGGGWPSLVAAGFVVLADRWYIPFEERAMRRRFGDDYERYRRRVRRWI